MSKMREAFEKWEKSQQERLAYHGGTCNILDFEAGYQAAIADVKAGGVIAKVAYPVDTIPYAHLVRNCDLSALVGTKLYKLPEDV